MMADAWHMLAPEGRPVREPDDDAGPASRADEELIEASPADNAEQQASPGMAAAQHKHAGEKPLVSGSSGAVRSGWSQPIRKQ